MNYVEAHIGMKSITKRQKKYYLTTAITITLTQLVEQWLTMRRVPESLYIYLRAQNQKKKRIGGRRI